MEGRMDLSRFNWDLLKIFTAVAETGSITAAAARLKIGQATVTRGVDELEASLGHPLFVRSTKGMELNDAGSLVLRSSRNMSESVRHLSTSIADLKETTRPKVTIAAHDAIATYWLARRLPAFQQANPGIEIVLRVVQQTPRIGDDEIDIAIQYAEPQGQNVIMRQLGRIHYLLYAAPAYLRIHGTPQDRFELGRHRMLHHTGYVMQPEEWGGKIPAWQEIVPWIFKTNSSTVLVEACAADGGIASMPSYVASFETRLVPLVHLRAMGTIKFWLAYHERLKGDPQYRSVIDWLLDSFDVLQHPWFREEFVAPPVQQRLE